jgi:hypothetical protein
MTQYRLVLHWSADRLETAWVKSDDSSFGQPGRVVTVEGRGWRIIGEHTPSDAVAPEPNAYDCVPA